MGAGLANCRQCGQELVVNVRFCPNCGIENPLDSRTTPPQSINSKGKSKTKLVQRMFWTVVVVAGIVYFSGHHTQNQNQTASSSNNAESASSADPGSASSVTSSSTPATAPSQPAAPTSSTDDEEVLAQAGGWMAATYTKNGGDTVLCQAGSFTPNGGLFEFSINASKNTQSIIISNPQWQLKKDSEIPIGLNINGTAFSFVAHTTDSQDAEAVIRQKEFASILSALPIVPSFTLQISGYSPEQVSLDGASVAIPAMQVCAAEN